MERHRQSELFVHLNRVESQGKEAKRKARELAKKQEALEREKGRKPDPMEKNKKTDPKQKEKDKKYETKEKDKYKKFESKEKEKDKKSESKERKPESKELKPEPESKLMNENSKYESKKEKEQSTNSLAHQSRKEEWKLSRSNSKREGAVTGDDFYGALTHQGERGRKNRNVSHQLQDITSRLEFLEIEVDKLQVIRKKLLSLANPETEELDETDARAKACVSPNRVSFPEKSPIQSPSRPVVINAERPMVAESFKIVYVTYPSRNSNFEFGVYFEFDEMHACPLELVMSVEYQGANNDHALSSLNPTISEIREDSRVSMSRRDYFIHMEFLNGKESVGVYKWLKAFTHSGVGQSNTWMDTKETSTINFDKELLTKEEGALVTTKGFGTRGVTIAFRLLVQYYQPRDEIATKIPKPLQPTSREAKMAMLYNVRGQLYSEVTFIVGPKLLSSDSVAINQAILGEFSLIFRFMFDPTKVRREGDYSATVVLPYMSKKSLDYFYNWIYGLDLGVWHKDIELNLELLQFAQEYMITELIQICTDNLVKTRDILYTLPLIIRTGKLAEMFEIPDLEDRVFDWMKRKTGNYLEPYPNKPE